MELLDTETRIASPKDQFKRRFKIEKGIENIEFASDIAWINFMILNYFRGD